MASPLIAVDFDGVLVRPYTDPEELFPSAMESLRQLAAMGARVAVVSSNPRAYHVLREHLAPAGPILAIRARSTTKWWAEGTGAYAESDPDKGAMLRSIVKELTEAGKHTDCLLFVDDKPEKVLEVTAAYPNWSGKPGEPRPTHGFEKVTALVVPSHCGLPSWGYLLGLIS